MQSFPESKLIRRQVLYEGRIVDLVVDEIELEGRSAIREVVRHPGGVVVLGVLENGLIPFVKQHRYPMDQVLIELPAGKIDPEEHPEVSAAREMEEETGFRPVEMELACTFYSSPGFCDELLYCYYSGTLVPGTPNREHDEHLTVELYTLDQALKMAGEGEIRDGKTLTALYWLKCRLSGE